MKELFDEALIEEYRGDLLENCHRGHICVINEADEVVAHVGNPEHVTYMRSSAKPIQALAFMALGLDDYYHLTDQERTIIAGSHQGGPYHIEALESIARKMDIDENALVLLPTWPASQEYRDAAILAGKTQRKFYHNCAGKHLATIAMARYFGQNERTYYQKGTSVQKYLQSFISKITGCPEEKISIGVDGCGVPVYGMPLHDMARGFLRVGCPDLLPDEKLREKAILLNRVMHENNRYINRDHYVCTCMNEDPNVFAKGGAQGVYCFALRDKRLAVSFKVTDGSEEEWQLVIWEILRQLGYRDTLAMNNMIAIRPFEITNATGHIVGMYRSVFELKIDK